MFRRSRKQKSKENARGAFELALQLGSAVERSEEARLPRRRRLRKIVPIAGLASLAAVPQVRERLAALVAAAGRNREQLQDLGTRILAGNARPNALDELTKEELYARAKEAAIAGRSEMSKGELVAALRANGS